MTDLHARLLAELDHARRARGRDEMVGALRAVVELHAIVHRVIGWASRNDGQYAEIPVCGHCAPKHAHFASRADVPEGECPTIKAIARELGIETGEGRD